MVSLNARSVTNKIDKLEILLLTYDPHFVVITETWLHDGIWDEEIIPANYQLYRRDHGSRGGGVAIIVKSNITVTVLDQIPLHESLLIRVLLGSFTFLLCGAYRTPDADDSFLYLLYDQLLTHRD